MNYLIGTWILGVPPYVGEFEFSIDWITAELNVIWQPMLVGSLLMAVLLSVTGYLCMRMYWRWWVMKRYRRRTRTHSRSADPGQP